MMNTFTRFQKVAIAMVLLTATTGTGWIQAQTSHLVAVTNNIFTPKELTITAGDTVIWRNTQGSHNVNGNKSKFPNNPVSFGNAVASGWTFKFVFTVPGVYDYQCDPHAGFGMTGKVTVLSNPNNLSLTTAFSGMTPHVGETLWLSVSDTVSGEEISRIRAEVRESFSLKVQGLKQGHSYRIDFYTDHNGNGKYDVPPADHAWRLHANNITGDTQLNFTHNTNFTNIRWKNKLTVDFAGMTPHVGEMFTFYLKDTVSGLYKDTIKMDPVPGATFQVISYEIVPGSSYFLDFYADHNHNGIYDAPPADHAWRMKLSGVTGDTTLAFTHNTIFTDIFKQTSGIGSEQVIQDFQVYPNPATSRLNISGTGIGSGQVSVSIRMITGALMLTEQFPAGLGNLAVDINGFSPGFYILTIRSGQEIRNWRIVKE